LALFDPIDLPRAVNALQSFEEELKPMDQQIDYFVGMPLAIFDDAPVANPTIPSPGILSLSESQDDGFEIHSESA
jgi:hypothetical protein